MALWYDFDPTGRFLVFQGVGAAKVDAWIPIARRAFREPAFHPGTHILSDRRELDVPSPGDVDEAMAFFRSEADRLAGRRWAIVTNQWATSYGMARMIGLYAEGIGMVVQPFVDLVDALAWLLDEPRESQALENAVRWVDELAASRQPDDAAPC